MRSSIASFQHIDVVSMQPNGAGSPSRLRFAYDIHGQAVDADAKSVSWCRKLN
jgi:hypothetical protein